MGTQPADVLHDRAEKGGGQMTQRVTNGARTVTWLSQSTVSLYMVSVSWILMSIAMLFTSPLLKPLFVL